MKLKKFEQKDRYGNMFSIEFDTSVPEMSMIPEHPGKPIGTDTVPAWLTPGEFVMNAESVRMFEPQIEAMNNAGRTVQAAQGGTIPEYAYNGGAVPLPKPKPKIKDVPALNPQELYTMLRDRGFTDIAARGIMGNFYAESKLDPDARQILSDGTTGEGRGLAQWESGGRFNKDPLNLVDFSNERGTKWTDPETQLDFMIAEMENSKAFGAVRDQINQANTPAEAAKIFLEGYEKANPQKAHLDTRIEYASNFQPKTEKPSMLTSIASLFSPSTPAQASEVPEITNDIPVPVPQDIKPIDSITPFTTALTGTNAPVTSTITDLLAAAQAQYKAPGGSVTDPEAEALSALQLIAQQATANNGMYIGDETLEEGGTNYDAARHAEDIKMMQDLSNQKKIADMNAASDAALIKNAAALIPPSGDSDDLGTAPTAQRVIGKLFDNEVFADIDGEYIIGPDNTPIYLSTDQMNAVTGRAEVPKVATTSEVPEINEPPRFNKYDTNKDGIVDSEEAKKAVDLKLAESRLVPNLGGSGIVIDSPEDVLAAAEINAQIASNQIDIAAETGTAADITAAANALKDAEAKADRIANSLQAQQAHANTASAMSNAEAAAEAAKNAQDKANALSDAGLISRAEAAQAKADELKAIAVQAEADAEAAKIAEDNLYNEEGVFEITPRPTSNAEDGTSASDVANTEQKSEVLNAIINDLEATNDGSAEGATSTDATNAVVNAGADGTDKVNKAESFLSGIFGDLFDAGELKRIAILYTGSRLMGGSHNGSLSWAAKQYLTRVDAKAADHAAQVTKLINDGKYTNKSIQKYKETKDASVLVPVGLPVNPTGTKEMWYSPSGKRIQAEKFKVGDGYIWSADGGKTAIPASWTQEASRYKGTDAYNDRIRAEVPLIKDAIEELSTTIGDVVPGDSARGINRTQKTGITPARAAMEAAEWAAKNNIDVASMTTYVEQAYRMAVQQSGGENDVKPQSLLPYLNQLKLRQDTGVGQLFTVTTKDGAEVPMDAVKVEALSLQFLKRADRPGKISDGANRDAVNLFWTNAAEIWNKKVSETPDIVQQYQKRALPGETAFYAYAKEQLNLPME